MTRFWIVLALLPLIFGCASSTQEKASDAKPLKGKWVGKMEAPKDQKDDLGAKMAEGLMGMFGDMEIEFPSEDRFVMTVMGLPASGSVVRKGDEIVLTPTMAMGMSVEEAKKEADGADLPTETITLVMSADGTKLTSKPTKEGEQSMVFERAKDEPAKPVEEKVKGGVAKDLLGTWKGEIILPEPDKPLTDDEKKEREMVESMNKGITLDLKADETFEMMMMVKVKGNWKVADGKLTLTPTEMMGMKMTEEELKDPDNKPLVGEIQAGGKEIVIRHEDPKQGILKLSRP